MGQPVKPIIRSPGGIKFLFCCIANDRVGFGHLQRLINLAQVFTDNQVIVDFLVVGSGLASLRVAENGYRCKLLGWNGDKEVSFDFEDRGDEGEVYSGIVIDASHLSFFAAIESQNLSPWPSGSKTLTVVIDSVGNQSLLRRFPTIKSDLQIIPYVYVNEGVIQKGPGKSLIGPEFAILDKSFADSAEARSLRDEATRVLITCGGSDPTRLSERVLKNLVDLDWLQINIVVGPLFSQDHVKSLDHVCRTHSQQVSISRAPKNLSKLMVNSDLAIATSGLTKYELAASGTPSILISIDSIHDQMNKSFSTLGSVIDLGFPWSDMELKEQVNKLRYDKATRQRMSDAGRAIVDGHGGQRIFNEIMEVSKC